MPKMTKEEFQQRITAIGTCEDASERMTMLADLSVDGGEMYDDFEAVTTERDNVIADNERLREANMQLFLRVGDPGKPTGKHDGEPVKKKFDDLFDEKGGIK